MVGLGTRNGKPLLGLEVPVKRQYGLRRAKGEYGKSLCMPVISHRRTVPNHTDYYYNAPERMILRGLIVFAILQRADDEWYRQTQEPIRNAKIHGCRTGLSGYNNYRSIQPAPVSPERDMKVRIIVP